MFCLQLLCGLDVKSFFKLIPNEIEEAAYIDGASRYIVIYKIIIPLAAPGIASVAIFCFIFHGLNIFLLRY